MICDHGSEMKHSEHKVKTLAKASEYYPAELSDLPITIETHTSYTGRVCLKVWDNQDNLIYSKG